jgi:hypothetical protein
MHQVYLYYRPMLEDYICTYQWLYGKHCGWTLWFIVRLGHSTCQIK